MDFLLIIYIFVLFVIFSPNFLLKSYFKNHILQTVFHGILFSVLFYLTYNHLEYRNKEGATIGTYQNSKNNEIYDITMTQSSLGVVPESDTPTPPKTTSFNNKIKTSNKITDQKKELTKMPSYDYSKFNNYDYDSMEKKVKMLETHQHTDQYYDLTPNFKRTNHEILCASDYGKNTTCCRQPENYVPDDNVCGPLKPYCTNYIHGVQWGKCVANNPHPKPNLGNTTTEVITNKTIIQPQPDKNIIVYNSPDIQKSIVKECPRKESEENI